MREMQERFERSLPVIRRAAEFWARRLRGQLAPDDFVGEVLALCWGTWRRLEARGREPWRFASKLADWHARHALRGRRFAGPGRGGNNRGGQAGKVRAAEMINKGGAGRLHFVALVGDVLDGSAADPAELAALRIDWESWTAALPDAYGRLVAAWARGAGRLESARLAGIAPSSVSRLRAQLSARFRAYRMA